MTPADPGDLAALITLRVYGGTLIVWAGVGVLWNLVKLLEEWWGEGQW